MSDDDRLAAATRALRETPPEDDELAAAVRAAREEGEPPLGDVQETRRRVLVALGEQKTRRPWYTSLAFQLAAVLLTATAWAATTGRLRPITDAVRTWIAPEAAPARETSVGRSRRAPNVPRVDEPEVQPPTLEAAEPAVDPSLEAAEAPVDPSLEAAEPNDEVDSTSVPAPTPDVARSEAPTEIAIEVRAPSRSTARATRAAEPSSADLASYRTAHRAHFEGNDPAAALAAWERYLDEQPRGVFRVEARYNRALSLVRLGRNAEAVDALQPFARGEVGRAYRQHEAAALLEALRP